MNDCSSCKHYKPKAGYLKLQCHKDNYKWEDRYEKTHIETDGIIKQIKGR